MIPTGAPPRQSQFISQRRKAREESNCIIFFPALALASVRDCHFERCATVPALFPLLAAERVDRHALDSLFIHAAHFDAVAVRVGAERIKPAAAAADAEVVPGRVCPEGVATAGAHAPVRGGSGEPGL